MNYIITDHLQVSEERLARMTAEELIAYATEARDNLTAEQAEEFIERAKTAIKEREEKAKQEAEKPQRKHRPIRK